MELVYPYRCGECGENDSLTMTEIDRHHRICSAFGSLLAAVKKDLDRSRNG